MVGRRKNSRKKAPAGAEVTETVKGDDGRRATKKIPLVKTMTFPVTEKDEEIVKCSLCHDESTFRQFRIHNITEHYNLAMVVGDHVERNYKFFVKQLMDMARLLKISTFNCPNSNCDSRYKSALGLAYHLELCGKSEAEIKAALVSCEVCGKKYASSNINWHKKSHAAPAPPPVLEPSEPPVKSGTKRQSALRAKHVLENIAAENESDKSTKRDSVGSSDKDLKGESEEEQAGETKAKAKGKARVKKAPVRKVKVTAEPGIIPSTHSDISYRAFSALQTEVAEPQIIWDKPVRLSANKFQDLFVNPLTCYETEAEAQSYLPINSDSVEFRTKTSVNEEKLTFKVTDFHRLQLFESEITDSSSGNNMINVGGAVSAMAWHPSGQYLAVSTLKDVKEKPNIINNVEQHRTCLQFYRNAFSLQDGNFTNGLDLELVLGIDNGYIHHLQWSSFWPLANSATNLPPEEDFVGHIAYACADSTISILCIRKSYFDSSFNVTPSSESNRIIRMYKKVPEICLRLNDCIISNAGQCITFDWHENSEYLAAGYGKGLVAVYNVQTSSQLLRKITEDSEHNTTVEIQPIWYIRGHTQAVSVVQFNPANSRFLVTSSHDYWVKTWDLDLRTEMECKKVGLALAGCWIRGWFHILLSFEMVNLNFQAGSVNMVRFFQVGNTKNYTTCADHFNATCLSFFQGMVAQGSELGRVTISYYDGFLRECDYDRNKKKKNTIDFSKVSVEKSNESDCSLMDDKLIFTLQKSTRQTHSNVPEPKQDELEQYINFYDLIRVNKVNWCPTGQQLATGYNNGILSVTPISFKSLYTNYYGARGYRQD